MAFNPSAFGFKTVESSIGPKRRDFCYVRMSKDRNGKKAAILCLDEETTAVAREMFGDRVGVGIDDRCRIVIYRGDARTLSRYTRTEKMDKATISLASETETFRDCLGMFKAYEFTPRIYAKGEAILLSPKGIVD